jgi:type IV secretory pathway component VirB8
MSGADNKSAEHAAVRAADPYAYRTAHRRVAWLLRLSVMTNVSLTAVVVVMTSAFATLLPLKEIRPALLRVDTADNRLYRVEPIKQEVQGVDLLMEQMARRYVKLILEIDAVTQTDRFREAFVMTADAFYKQFKKQRIDSGAIQDALDSGLERTILVQSADRISERAGVYRFAVDIVQVDRRKGAEIERKNLRAYLAMTLRAHEVREDEKFQNPLGIRILDMSLKERNNS